MLLAIARQTPGVSTVHALRTRYIGSGIQVDMHILVDPELTVREGHDIADGVRDRLLDADPDVIDVLLHIEPHLEDVTETRVGLRRP